jgi:hypothetical protein
MDCEEMSIMTLTGFLALGVFASATATAATILNAKPMPATSFLIMTQPSKAPIQINHTTRNLSS